MQTERHQNFAEVTGDNSAQPDVLFLDNMDNSGKYLLEFAVWKNYQTDLTRMQKNVSICLVNPFS